MNARIATMIGLGIGVVMSAAGCRDSAQPSAPKSEPAHVDHHVEEASLNRVTLTEQAEQRLGIELVPIVRSQIQRQRTVAGEVVIPPGQTITVSAPIAGTVLPPTDGTVPAPGSRLEAGQIVFTFLPLLSPERDVLTPAERIRVAQTRADVATVQIEARRQIESAKVSLEIAQLAYDRAVQLLKNKAGSQRSVDEAQSRLDLAQEALTTAEERSAFLASVKLDEEAGELESRDIQSPVQGVLQELSTAEGETVAAGEMLFRVITTNQEWIRVPVYVGQWHDVDTSQVAKISEYGSAAGVAIREAKYVSAPPSADPTATTVDLYYEIDNEDGQLYPGQRLPVTLPLHGQSKSLVVPLKAILYDIHGGTWVYQQVEDHVYARQRVSLDFVTGELAVLASGPGEDAKVVTDGAVELFGTEFGVGH